MYSITAARVKQALLAYLGNERKDRVRLGRLNGRWSEDRIGSMQREGDGGVKGKSAFPVIFYRLAAVSRGEKCKGGVDCRLLRARIYARAYARARSVCVCE